MALARRERRSRTTCAKKKVLTEPTPTKDLTPISETVAGQILPAPKVVGSSFDIECIVSSVRFVIDAAVSMRAASRICNVLAEIAGRPQFEEPSHTTVQNFMLRIGLYLLQRDGLRRADWIWIADHTIGAGTTKCFLVLGITLSDYLQLHRPLEHRDLEVLALIPVEQSNGAIVHQQLGELVDRCGVPLAVVSDRGSDLKKGIALLQQDHPRVISLDDIVHLVSRLIETILLQDPRWNEYRKASCDCANRVRQGKLAHLKPPRPKTKARYMNIDREVRWGARALSVLDRVRKGELTERQHKRLPRLLVEEKLGWLDEYRDAIGMWLELSSLGQGASRVIRRCGYAASTVDTLRLELGQPDHRESQQLVERIIEKVEPLCAASSDYAKLPGSSEVLESLIGKGKRLLGSSNNSNSLTRQILAMVTSTAEITPELVRIALSTCRMKHLSDWCRRHLRPGIHRDRREDLQSTQAEENLHNTKFAATPTF